MNGIFWQLASVLSILFEIAFMTALCEFRYSRRTTALAMLCVLLPLSAFTLWFYNAYGSAAGGRATVFIVLPGLLLYYVLSRYRDGRLFFTFGAASGIVAVIIQITNLLDSLLPGEGYLVMFLSRLVLFPLVFWAMWRWVRTPYMETQRTVQVGWGGFAVISLLYYPMLSLAFNYPSTLSARPAYIPAMLLLVVIMLLTYWQIIRALLRQQELFRIREQEQLLQSQMTIMQQRVEQNARMEEALSIQRHDLRHRFRTLDALLEQGDTAAAREYVSAADGALAETAPRRWCKNPTLDAMFAVYLGAAEAEGIRVEADLDIPAKLPVDAAELSTAFANALENAITAAKELPEEERVIRVRAIHEPQIMFRVSNPYAGEVTFDEQGRPVAKKPGHGFGVRSIEAYCEKHGAFCEFKVGGGWFEVSIAHV